MLGLILIYFIGKAFFDFADAHRKNKWLFAILGVVSYYVGTFFGGIAIALYYELIIQQSLVEVNSWGLRFLAVPFGLFFCWGFYTILKRQWSRKRMHTDLDLLDEGLDD